MGENLVNPPDNFEKKKFRLFLHIKMTRYFNKYIYIYIYIFIKYLESA